MGKKNILNWSLAAVLLCGAGLSFTACSDDDDDENRTEQRADADPMDTDEARTALRWLCTLTDVSTLPDNWKSKTFDVTIGQTSSQNELWRVVVVDDLDEAKQQFSLLADLTADELSGKQVVNGGAAGTMTWTPSAANAKNLAEVTVSSRLFPKLQKIVFCTEEQVGDNGLIWDSMKGTAYYRLGDVIKDPEGYYWVCVRPAFKPDNKKSHWINIINTAASGGNVIFPPSNIADTWDNLPKYDNQTILLPTKLSYNRQHLYNLSNFIWAMLFPDKYSDACLTNGSKGLGDFDYKYHGVNFLKMVSGFWDQKVDERYSIWEVLFNRTREQMQQMQTMNLIYQGYSWKFGESGNLWIYRSEGYQPKYSGKESQDEKSFNFVQGGFNIRVFAGASTNDPKPYAQFINYGNDTYSNTWVVRYKTGAELMTAGSYSPYRDIKSKDGKQQDVYVFNTKTETPYGENVEPKDDNSWKDKGATNANLEPGMLIGSDGLFYYDVPAMLKAGVQPAAMVVVAYSEEPVEAGTNYNCMALALNSSMTAKVYAWGEEGKDCGLPTCWRWQDVSTILNGISATQHLADGCNKGHEHPAAKACATCMTGYLSDATRQQKGFSQWFLPSMGQWKLALQNMGATRWYDAYGYMLDTELDNAIKKRFQEAQLGDYAVGLMSTRCHTSTPHDDNMTNSLFLGQTWLINGVDKSFELMVRPCIAFHKDRK